MPALERSIALKGPKFYRDGGHLLFVNHIDGSTRDGPRPATDDDKAAHPKAYAVYREELAAPAPFAPLVSFKDPPGGRPPKGPSDREDRRAAAAAAEAE